MARALFLCALQLLAFSASTTLAQKRIVCYYNSVAVNRAGDGKFDTTNINPSLCTHLIYASIGANADGTVKILDQTNDVTLEGFKKFNNLRLVNTNLKTLVSLGGPSESSSTLSTICNNPTLRATFVTNLFNFVNQTGFNGLDLNWQFPAQKGGIAADKANFVLLIKELRAKFTPQGFLLSAAVSAWNYATTLSYDVPALSTSLDFINLMTFDYHGSWESVTGHNSPLYASTTESNKTINVDASIQNWIKLGADVTKLVLGIPLYGRSFTLSGSGAGLGAPVSGAGTAGPFSNEAGRLLYNEICSSQKTQTGWTTVFQPAQQVPYSSRSNQWVGFENQMSAGNKAKYAKNMRLGGVMVWSLDGDDFRNTCGAGKFPLLTTIKSFFTA